MEDDWRVLGEQLRRLDRKVVDKPWSTRWLVALSVLGLVLAGVVILGLMDGSGGGAGFGVIGTMIFVPLAEISRRHQAARGKQAFAWFMRLDDRVYGSSFGRHVPGSGSWRAVQPVRR